jgi:hypothetical protein
VDGETARKALGLIRLVNGAAGLLVPGRLIERMQGTTEHAGSGIYFARLFGVRTVVLGIDLLSARGNALDRALTAAVPIHASDTVAALLAGLTGTIPKRPAAMLVAISSVNTALASIASRGRRT